MFKTFIKGGFIYFISSFLSKGIGFLLLPIYTRFLSPDEYGQIDLVILVATLIKLTIALEITQSIGRFMNESDAKNRRKLVNTGFSFVVLMYAVFFIIGLILYKPLGEHLIQLDTDVFWIYHLGLLYVITNGLFLFFQHQLKWNILPLNHALSSLIFAICTGIIATILLYFGMGILSILIAMNVAALIGSIYSLKKLPKFKFMIDEPKLKKMLRYSIPLVPSSVAVFFANYIDRISINALLGISELGIYSIALKVASVVSIILVGFQTSLTPIIYQHYREAYAPFEIEKIFRLLITLIITFFLGALLFSTEIVNLITTSEFYSSAELVPYLLIGIAASSLYLTAPGLFIAKKTKMIAIINIIMALANLIFNILFIPSMGLKGAAFSTVLSGIISFILYVALGQKHYKIPYLKNRLIFVLLITLVMTIIIELITTEIGIFTKLTILCTVSIINILVMMKTCEIKTAVNYFRQR